MTSIMYRPIYIVAVFISVLNGFGSPLRLITEPPSFYEGSEKLNVTCVADGPTHWAKTVISFQIIKQGQDAPMISINMKQDLIMGPGTKDNMKAEGHIDTDASKSYLSLIIVKPSIEDVGNYKCQMFYFDEKMKINEENVITNITLYERDITDIVTDLVKKVSTLTKTVQEQEGVMKNMTRKVELLNAGWAYYEADQTYLKGFGLYDYEKHDSWSKSREECRKFGGDLVQIRDQDKNAFVYGLRIDSVQKVWIGVRNVAKTGLDFRYVDGSPVDTFKPWKAGQPHQTSKLAGDNKCVYVEHVNNRLQWGIYGCSYSHAYVCSIPAH